MAYLVHQLLYDAAGRDPHKTCLESTSKSWSYEACVAAARNLAAALIELGLQRGERVATWLLKSPEEALSLLGISAAGGIFVDINRMVRPRQVEHILRDCQASMIVVPRSRLRSLTRLLDPHGGGLPDLRAVLVLPDIKSTPPLPEGAPPVLDLVQALETPAAREIDCPSIDRDPAGIIYTSGSTGLPKGVVVSHHNVVAGARCVSSYVRNTSDDAILSILPFSFDYGLNQLTSALCVGATLVLQPYLGPADVLSAARELRVTGLAGIPPLWADLLQLDWSADDFAELRYITNSGGTFPVEMVRRYRERLPRTRIYLMYGLTEAFRSTYLEPAEIDRRPDSMGKAVPNAEILVLDPEGRPCKPGEVGELVHRGAHVALGYWNAPELTAARFRPDPTARPEVDPGERVVYSGDYVRTDEEGYLYFVGRRDEMIKASGFRVSPTEIEEYFHNEGDVSGVVAFAIKGEGVDDTIVVVATLKSGATLGADELRKRVARAMPSYMAPAEIVLRDRFPRTANGKIDRTAVKRDFLAGRQG
jgi:acyl-CoA ligase (AMP-forming) (exosortase A-associated)